MCPESATSGIRVDEIIHKSKHAALDMGDITNKECVVVHLVKCYDAINV